MGYDIVCVPQSKVYHLGGASLPQGNPKKTKLNFRNNIVMMWKNLPEYNVEDDVILTGCFCAERCNRIGVTITVDDDVYEGVTPFETEGFFKEHILSRVSEGGA